MLHRYWEDQHPSLLDLVFTNEEFVVENGYMTWYSSEQKLQKGMFMSYSRKKIDIAILKKNHAILYFAKIASFWFYVSGPEC